MCDCMTQEDAMNMSNEQAIQILKPFRDMMIDQHGCPTSSAVFALDKAIDALSEQPERKIGAWEQESESLWKAKWNRWKCSACGKHVSINFDGDPIKAGVKFCPHCGSFNGGNNDNS